MPYALDLSCVDDLAETMVEATGLQALAESAMRRLTTPRGALLDEDDYGLDVRRFLHRAMTRVEELAIPGQIRQELLKEDGIETASVTVLVRTSQRLALEVRCVTVDGPLELLLEVGADGRLVASATIQGVLLSMTTAAKEAA